MNSQMKLGDIEVEVVLKNIKNLHLRVYPPAGRVRISAPKRMSMNTIRKFALSKLSWIKQQQTRLRERERAKPRNYIDRERHYVWGDHYLLKVTESNARPSIELADGRMHLRVRPGTDECKREGLVEVWYRLQLKQAIPPLLERWEPRIGVRVERFFVRRMKTKWGSCNTRAHTIRLNTELARKSPACLEYVVVHELVHLLEPSHNARFVALMDQFMPGWKRHRQELNQYATTSSTGSPGPAAAETQQCPTIV
jgi:predicted metal-dependent hydrolase